VYDDPFPPELDELELDEVAPPFELELDEVLELPSPLELHPLPPPPPDEDDELELLDDELVDEDATLNPEANEPYPYPYPKPYPQPVDPYP
jgi:hypothetical protein